MPKLKGYQLARVLKNRPRPNGCRKHTSPQNLNPGPLQTQLAEYQQHLIVRNYSERTVFARAADLKRFLLWIQDRGIDSLEQITRLMIEDYQIHLWQQRKADGSPLAFSTQLLRLQAIAGFFGFLCRKRILDANPASDLDLPKREKRLPVNSLSVADIEKLLDVPDVSDPLGIRDRAILELFYSSAIRRSELVHLKTTDLNRDLRTLWIRQGKGHKDRVVPIGHRALRWLDNFLNEVRPLLLRDPDELALFLTAYGVAFSPDVLTRLIRKMLDAAGIRHPGSCHLLRHTCATQMLEEGADIRYIQQLLGHADLRTTSIYTEVNIRQLRRVHDRTHPAEKQFRKQQKDH